MYTAMREVSFPVVSLGSRRESSLDVSQVAAWLRTKKGSEADIISYETGTLLSAQLPAVSFPAAGGEFYAARMKSALGADENGRIIHEIYPDAGLISDDVRDAVARVAGCRFSLPSPSALGLKDVCYADTDDYEEAVTDAYLCLCRGMRDLGVSGHIFLAMRPSDYELERFGGRKFIWATPADQLERVLESTRDIVIESRAVERLSALADSYQIRLVYLLDADTRSLSDALRVVDFDNLFIAGYAPGEDMKNYWKNLAELKIAKSA